MAKGNTSGWGVEDGRSRSEGLRNSGLGKSLTQLQAETMAERRFTDLMASAGIGTHQMAQEVLFHLPRDFVDLYEELFYRAFGGKDDGGVNARGQSAAENGILQKGKTAARKGVGKRYKRHWIIADENAVSLKEKVDKRLRALAREVRLELEGEERAEGRRCAECGRMLGAGWKYCSSCGTMIDASR